MAAKKVKKSITKKIVKTLVKKIVSKKPAKIIVKTKGRQPSNKTKDSKVKKLIKLSKQKK